MFECSFKYDIIFENDLIVNRICVAYMVSTAIDEL